MIKLFKTWKELRRINQDLLLENAELNAKIYELEKRLRRAGSLPYEYFEDENITTVYAESRPYGEYAIVNDDDYDKVIDVTKQRIVKSIVKSLIDMNLIQFIVKNSKGVEFDPAMVGMTTVGAKLNVIPWEQVVRKIQLFPKVEEEYGKYKNADNNGSKTGSGYACVFTGEIETSQTENPIGEEMEEE